MSQAAPKCFASHEHVPSPSTPSLQIPFPLQGDFSPPKHGFSQRDPHFPRQLHLVSNVSPLMSTKHELYCVCVLFPEQTRHSLIDTAPIVPVVVSDGHGEHAGESSEWFWNVPMGQGAHS